MCLWLKKKSFDRCIWRKLLSNTLRRYITDYRFKFRIFNSLVSDVTIIDLIDDVTRALILFTPPASTETRLDQIPCNNDMEAYCLLGYHLQWWLLCYLTCSRVVDRICYTLSMPVSSIVVFTHTVLFHRRSPVLFLTKQLKPSLAKTG